MGPPRLQRAQVAPPMPVHVMFLLIMLFSAPERRAWHGALMAYWRVGGYAPTRHLVFMRVLDSYGHVDMHSCEKSRPRDVRTHLGPTREVHAHMACWRVGGYAPTRHLAFMRVLGWYRHIDMYSREKSGLRDVRTHLGPTREVHARYFCHAVTCPSVLF